LWTIGYVGRVRREKGVDILLHAISILAANGGDFRLVVVGDGPQLAECQELAADLRMASRISWLGVISPQELPSHYRSFDVLAVPSRSEGFGLVAVEAMAQGVPVVAARVGGLPEIVADGLTGLLFEPGNEYDLAHQLETLMANRVLVRQLAGAARERAAQCFSRDRYRTSLDQIYRALTR
jgi:glycosyltransferase involved in cell wall biosynthesis